MHLHVCVYVCLYVAAGSLCTREQMFEGYGKWRDIVGICLYVGFFPFNFPFLGGGFNLKNQFSQLKNFSFLIPLIIASVLYSYFISDSPFNFRESCTFVFHVS